jgi:hypothetical protein
VGESRLERVQVMRGEAGPFAGVRLGQAIAYEFELDDSFVPRLRPGMTRLERVFVLLDVGVQLSNPPYWRGSDAACWYVDLVAVSGGDGRRDFPPATITPLAALPPPLTAWRP